MKILSRQIKTSKTPEEIIHILQGTAYPGKRATFTGNEFSMYYLKKRPFRYRVVVPVKGKIIEPKSGVVKLTVQANPSYYFCISMFFVFALLCIKTVYTWICSGIQRWEPLGILLFGMLLSAQPLWDSIEILDSLETKLTCNTD